MKRLLLIAAAMCCALGAQVPVSPVQNPHVTFVNGAGAPCAHCTLQTFVAGTTTPLATYTDASGTSMNTNPIILDPAGGANIWVGNNSYKFVLKDQSGSTIWSVDQVNAGNLFPCSPASAVQIANPSASGLTCDSSITINTTNHTLNIGTLGAHYVTIGALGTPTSWTFDTTTPATALASLGAGAIAAGTINQLAIYPAAGSNIAGSSSIPDGITATTQPASDNSAKVATTAYVALPGAINPTSVQVASGTAITDNQGTGLKVQHSTGTTTSGDIAVFDASGNTTDTGIALPTAGSGLSTNGWASLPGGVIVEWGVITVSACGASHCSSPSTALPLTFPNAVFSCTADVQSENPTSGWNMVATLIPAFDIGHITVSLDTSQTSVHFTNSMPVGWVCFGH